MVRVIWSGRGSASFKRGMFVLFQASTGWHKSSKSASAARSLRRRRLGHLSERRKCHGLGSLLLLLFTSSRLLTLASYAYLG